MTEGFDPERRDHEATRTAHGSAGSEADPSVSNQPTRDINEFPDAAGDTDLIEIPNYEITGKLGQGGMGVVYEANQKNPRRRVAIKVIRGGKLVDDTRVRMFQREAQSLARLEHPCIAAIYESGRTDDGCHFFAMEYAPGMTLGKYLSRRAGKGALGAEELRFRLEMFRRISAAVHYAHQRGVIHRDLKPSNIVVGEGAGSTDSLRGDQPALKILDFGLARITDTDIQATVVTEIGAVKGTLPYMSPEQARGNPDAIDVRADVYSLGVMLYEMLSGALPKMPSQSSMYDALRTIAETPARPLREVYRGSGRLDPDLETICHKALELDPDARYESASALSDDIERFLSGLPILARAPSTVYQLRKLVARNKLATTFAVAVAVGLATLAVTMTLLRGTAERARLEAQERTQELEQVTAFQASMLANLDLAQVGTALYDDITERVRQASSSGTESTSASDSALDAEMAGFSEMLQRTNSSDVALHLLDEQVLQRALSTIESDFSEQPRIRATLEFEVAKTYTNLGLYPSALPLYDSAIASMERLFGSEDSRTLETKKTKGTLLVYMGDFDSALPLYQEFLDTSRRVLPEGHEQIVRAELGMMFVLSEAGRLEEALEYGKSGVEGAREVLEPDHLDFHTALNNLGVLYARTGDSESAAPLIEEALTIRRKILGGEHEDTLMAATNLAALLMRLERYEEADVHARAALEVRRRVLGDEHPNTMLSMGTVGFIADRQGNYEEALKYLGEAAEVQSRTLGPDHWITLESKLTVGDVLTKLDRPGEARELLRSIEPDARRVFVEAHRYRLGRLLARRGVAEAALANFETAERNLLEAQEILRELQKAHANHYQRVLKELQDLYEAWHVANPSAGHDEQARDWQDRRDPES